MHMFSRLIEYCFILFFTVFFVRKIIFCAYATIHMNIIVLWIFLYIYFSSVRQYHCQTLFLYFICNFIYPYLLNKNAYVYIFLFLPKFVPQTKIYLPFYIYICVYIIIYTNIFLKCAYLHTYKNIIYILLAAAIYTYCTSYRMHFLFSFLFILCTPIYPFFISFLCIHYHIYFCWRHLLILLLLFQRAGNNTFAFLFVCIFYMLFK